MKELIQEYKKRHVPVLKRRVANLQMIEAYFAPLEQYDRNTITTANIVDWMEAIQKRKPAVARVCLETCRAMFNKARLWGMVTQMNPTLGIRKPALRPHEEYVLDEEMPVLQKVLEAQPPIPRAYFMTVIETGARRNEGLHLEWPNVNIRTREVRLIQTKVKNKPKIVPISELLVEAYAALRNKHPRWVFCNEETGFPFSATWAEMRWMMIRAQCGLQHLRLHDLRHTTASWFGNLGANSMVIRDVLGHKTTQMTEKYTHLNNRPMRLACAEYHRKLYGRNGTNGNGHDGNNGNNNAA